MGHHTLDSYINQSTDPASLIDIEEDLRVITNYDRKVWLLEIAFDKKWHW